MKKNSFSHTQYISEYGERGKRGGKREGEERNVG